MLLQVFLRTAVVFLLALLVQPPRCLALPQRSEDYRAGPEWDAGSLQLAAPEGETRPWAFLQGWGPREALKDWKTEELKDWKREELGHRPLGTFTDNRIHALPYPEGGEMEEEVGEKRNEALTSIAGGLQAFSRQKGGFGFRFGRGSGVQTV